MLAKQIGRIAVASSRRSLLAAGNFTRRALSDKPMTPNLPGLSDDQINKIQVTDTSLRTRHYTIEADMTSEERDIARVREIQSRTFEN